MIRGIAPQFFALDMRATLALFREYSERGVEFTHTLGDTSPESISTHHGRDGHPGYRDVTASFGSRPYFFIIASIRSAGRA